MLQKERNSKKDIVAHSLAPPQGISTSPHDPKLLNNCITGFCHSHHIQSQQSAPFISYFLSERLLLSLC